MKMEFYGEGVKRHRFYTCFYATIVGFVLGELFSSYWNIIQGLGTKPVLAIIAKSSTGAGTNVIAGLATGMISTFPTVLLFAVPLWTVMSLWRDFVQLLLWRLQR